MRRTPCFYTRIKSRKSLNLSKHEQRVLHVLAQGGNILYARASNGKIHDITCFTRDGHVLTDCTFEVFQRLKKRRLIRSVNSNPYSITRLEIVTVGPQLDNL